MKNWHLANFYFFYFAAVGIIVPYWSLYLQFRGFDATQIGQLMAILLMTKVIAPNIWAAIADRRAAKTGSAVDLLIFAAWATLLIFCFTALTVGFWSMALAMFGFCVFWNACLPQLEAATLNHLGENRDQYGKIRLWGSIGFIVAVFVLGGLMDWGGPSLIMPAGGVALFCVAVASMAMNRQVPSAHSVNATDNTPLHKVITTRVMLLLILGVFMQLSHAPFYTFFSIYLESHHYSKLYIGTLWSFGVVCEIVVFIVSHRILSSFTLSRLLSVTFLVAAIRWVLLAQFVDFPVVVWGTQMMHAATYGLYHCVVIQLVCRLFQGSYQVRGQALYASLTYGLGGAIGSIASGYVWTYWGGEFLFRSAGIMMVFVFIFSWLFAERIIESVSPSDH